MKTLSFKLEHSYRQSVSGIEIPLTLCHSDREVRLVAKLDTGASYCVFQREYAEQLGIEVESGQQVSLSTPTGSFQAFGHELTMSCLGWRFDTTVYFAESRGFVRNVVGRAGWLDHFRLAIVDHDTMLYMSHYNE